MKYQSNLLKMTVHPMHSKLFQKLNDEELAAVTAFININEDLTDDEYAFICNRWYLDQPKPKHYSDMWSIVTQVRGL